MNHLDMLPHLGIEPRVVDRWMAAHCFIIAGKAKCVLSYRLPMVSRRMGLADGLIRLYNQYWLSIDYVGIWGERRMEHAIGIHVQNEVGIRKEGIGVALHGQMVDKTLLGVFKEAFYPYWAFSRSKCLLKLAKLIHVYRRNNNADLGKPGSKFPDGLQRVIHPEQISGKGDVEDGGFHEMKIIRVAGPTRIRFQRSG